MRKICVVDIQSEYNDYYDDNNYISGIIPETDWLEVTDEEYDSIKNATINEMSLLYRKAIIELIHIKPLFPKLKEELLEQIKKETKAKEERDRIYQEQNKAKLEKKKDTIIEKISKRIHFLQKEINNHMKSANERPEESDTHHMLAEKKMGVIRNLRDKHKMIKASKKELPKKDKE